MIHKKIKGFTFLEVLVALLILSVGLLGLASLQATGLKTNHNALLRSQATILAHDIADRMRANRPGVTAGNYNFTLPDSTAVPDCTDPSSNCNPAQIAAMDIDDWESLLARELPAGTGSVSCAATDCTVTASWTDSGASSTVSLLVRP